MRHITQVIFLLLALTVLALTVPALAAGDPDLGSAPAPAAGEAPPALGDTLPPPRFVGEPGSGEEPPDCDEEPNDPACCEAGSTNPECRPPVYPFPDPNGVIDDPPPPRP